MGYGFCLVSIDNNKNMLNELANMNLDKNWRYCGGNGCYALLNMLTGYEPTFCYDTTIDLETIKDIYKCVNYFVENKCICDESDFPIWCKNSPEYEQNRNVKYEIDEDTYNQAKLFAEWLKIGINNNCVIEIF